MNYQFASTYSLIIIMYLLALFLLLRYEKQNRARLFLAISFLLFGTSMLCQFIYAYVWNNVCPVGFSMLTLLTTTFICIVSLAYPLEATSPLSVTTKKVLILFIPFFIIGGICVAALLNGYVFQYYNPTVFLFNDLPDLDALVYLSLLAYIMACIVYTIVLLSTHRAKMLNKGWFRKYLVTFIAMNLSYEISLVSNAGLHMVSKYLFVLCCAYITYLELYERTNETTEECIFPHQLTDKPITVVSSRAKGLRITLVEYMEKEKAWRDPDLTVKDVTTKLRTNRRALNSVVQEMGYDNFPSYVNYLRVKDFTEIIENSKDDSFQNIFFNVGFKSRATAHRNFKNIKGVSPSEYYDSVRIAEEE